MWSCVLERSGEQLIFQLMHLLIAARLYYRNDPSIEELSALLFYDKGTIILLLSHWKIRQADTENVCGPIQLHLRDMTAMAAFDTLLLFRNLLVTVMDFNRKLFRMRLVHGAGTFVWLCVQMIVKVWILII